MNAKSVNTIMQVSHVGLVFDSDQCDMTVVVKRLSKNSWSLFLSWLFQSNMTCVDGRRNQ